MLPLKSLALFLFYFLNCSFTQDLHGQAVAFYPAKLATRFNYQETEHQRMQQLIQDKLPQILGYGRPSDLVPNPEFKLWEMNTSVLQYYPSSSSVVRSEFSITTPAQTRQTMAAFTIKTALGDDALSLDTDNEIDLLKLFNGHPNIVRYYGVAIDTRNPKQTLRHLFLEALDRRIEISDQYLSLFLEIAYAIQALHDQGIAHNDIKIENILLDQNNHVKLVDFDCQEKRIQGFKNPRCLSPIPASPEHLLAFYSERKNPILYDSFAADIFELGFTFLELLYDQMTDKGSAILQFSIVKPTAKAGAQLTDLSVDIALVVLRVRDIVRFGEGDVTQKNYTAKWELTQYARSIEKSRTRHNIEPIFLLIAKMLRSDFKKRPTIATVQRELLRIQQRKRI